MCLHLGFTLKTNVTVQFTEQISNQNILSFIKLVNLNDFGPGPVLVERARRARQPPGSPKFGLPPRFINYPYAESRNALEYAVFVNKSALVLNLIFLKLFDNFVWTAFFLAAILISFILCYSFQKGWSYFGTSLFWAIGIFLEQSNNRFESQVKRNVGGILIATWSLMMVILSNTYIDLFYAVLLGGVKPDVAPNLGMLKYAC